MADELTVFSLNVERDHKYRRTGVIGIRKNLMFKARRYWKCEVRFRRLELKRQEGYLGEVG